MEQSSPLQDAFDNFSSKSDSLEAIAQAIQALKESKKRPQMSAITSDIVAISSQSGDNVELQSALTEASQLLIDAFFGPKLTHCDSLFFPSKDNSI